MEESDRDIGVLTALAQRMRQQRLPRALAMKERVDAGGLLSDRDVAFLEEVLSDSNRIAPIVKRNAEYAETAARMVDLYKQITAKALENEQAPGT
jgi:hypothetical protein